MWLEPRDSRQLQADQVTVWCAELDSPWLDDDKLRSFLSEEEVEQANRFHFPIHRRRFILRRSLLRQFLGMYLNLPAQQIHFCRNTFGKPFLHPEFNSDIHFNISTSDDLVLLAFMTGRRIGVDIERQRPDIELEAIARRFFSTAEQDSLSSLSNKDRVEGFFNCWTRKEAFLKAIGQGLTLPLDQFEVSLAPGKPVKILATHFDPGEAQRWWIYNLDVAPDYAGALVVEGVETFVSCQRLVEGFL